MKNLFLHIRGVITSPVKNRITVLFLIMFALNANTIFSQTIGASIVSSGGESFTVANQTVEFTIGDIAVETYQNANSALTQGFLQGVTQGTGINKNFISAFHATVFPNPASGNINVICNNKPVSIEIFDLNGRKFHTIKNPQKTETIKIENFRKGIYLLRIVFEGNVPVTKHIIKF